MEGVADLERLRVLREALKELIVDVLVHEDTRARTAALAVVEATIIVSLRGTAQDNVDALDTERSPLDRLFHVGVVKDD